MQTDSKGLGDGLGFCFSAMLPGNADDIHWSMDHTFEQQPAIYLHQCTFRISSKDEEWKRHYDLRQCRLQNALILCKEILIF